MKNSIHVFGKDHCGFVEIRSPDMSGCDEELPVKGYTYFYYYYIGGYPCIGKFKFDGMLQDKNNL